MRIESISNYKADRRTSVGIAHKAIKSGREGEILELWHRTQTLAKTIRRLPDILI